MANLTETATWETGIYRIETTDFVQGGEGGKTNQPIKQLANRTLYLKGVCDALSASVAGLAPIVSPTFTGSPTTPTPPSGDDSLKIANTAWVRRLMRGALSKNVAGSSTVALTADEAGYGIIAFTGAITANIAVTVPASPGTWVVWNATTGSYTLTVKTPAGSGVVVRQGRFQPLWSDGVNVSSQQTDFDNIDMGGNPTATTQAAGNDSNRVATTAFVAALGRSMGGGRPLIQHLTLVNETWVVPAGVTRLKLCGWGGGGGGGGSAGTGGAAGGGGGGGYSEVVINVTPGQSLNVTVGTGGLGGGIGGTAGANGLTTSVQIASVDQLVATGGTGGGGCSAGSVGAGGTGGAGTVGALRLGGGDGASGFWTGSVGFGGAGGDSALGGGGGVGSMTVPTNGKFIGGGGGGACSAGGGGTGGGGAVLIEYPEVPAV